MPESATIKGGIYYTIEGYRRLIGYETQNAIRQAIKEDRLKGAIKIGDTWLIPQWAVITNNLVTHGGYAELKRIKEAWYKEQAEKKLLESEKITLYNKKGGRK